MNNRPRIILSQGRDQSVRRFHPWIFSGAKKNVVGKVQEGDLVDVYSHEGEFLATGHYQVGSIMVRILSFDPVTVDQAFWDQRILAAWRRREELGLTDSADTNVFRLVHGEGDHLPGLVIDYYDGDVVMQLHSVGMFRARDQLVKALQEVLRDRLRSLFDKSADTLPHKAGLDARDSYLLGSRHEAIVHENGLRFLVDWEEGQKTGFYIDQRDNRALLAGYAHGRKCLNLFGYTGGFSVYALKGGAAQVDTVDASAKAIALADKNISMNCGGQAPHHGIVNDAFDFLSQAGKDYDLMILDPPAFAKHGKVLDRALKGYRKLNARAMEKMANGGILFTFSCSQVVSRDEFRMAVFTAATLARRKVTILHQMSQPADHPINIYHPEGEYLKGLVLRIE